jgi:AAA+ ATPase superfamily predicted ATPase
MKNKVGNPARGKDFFNRHNQIEKILNRLENGNNLQIAAPRRVGKTSILWYLLDNQSDSYAYVYVDTEAIDESGDFFKKMMKAILAKEEVAHSSKLKQLFTEGRRRLSKIKSIKILGNGFDLNENKDEHDYYEDITNLLSSIELDGNQKTGFAY